MNTENETVRLPGGVLVTMSAADAKEYYRLRRLADTAATPSLRSDAQTKAARIDRAARASLRNART